MKGHKIGLRLAGSAVVTALTLGGILGFASTATAATPASAKHAGYSSHPEWRNSHNDLGTVKRKCFQRGYYDDRNHIDKNIFLEHLDYLRYKSHSKYERRVINACKEAYIDGHRKGENERYFYNHYRNY